MAQSTHPWTRACLADNEPDESINPHHRPAFTGYAARRDRDSYEAGLGLVRHLLIYFAAWQASLQDSAWVD